MIRLYDRESATDQRKRFLADLRPGNLQPRALLIVKTPSVARRLILEFADDAVANAAEVVIPVNELERRFLTQKKIRPLDVPELAVVLQNLHRTRPDLFEPFRSFASAKNSSLLSHGMLRRLAAEINELLMREERKDPVAHSADPYIRALVSLAEVVQVTLASTGAWPRQPLLWKLMDELTHADLRNALMPAERIIFDYFDTFEPWLWQFFKQVAAFEFSCDVFLDFNPNSACERRHFAHLASAWENLLSLGGIPTTREANRCMSSVPAIECYTAPSREEEVRAIAKFLRAEMDASAADPFPFDDYLICFPNLQDYAPIVRRVFRDFGIPYRLARWREFQASPLWQALASFAKIASHDESYETILDLLRSAFAGPSPADRPDVRLFEKLCWWRSRFGSWLGLTDFCEDVRKHLLSPAQDSAKVAGEADDDKESWTPFADEDERKRVAGLLHVLEQLDQWLTTLRGHRTIVEWAAILTKHFRPYAEADTVGWSNALNVSTIRPWNGLSISDFLYLRDSVRLIMRLLNRLCELSESIAESVHASATDGAPTSFTFSELLDLLVLLGGDERVADHSRHSGGFQVVGAFDIVAAKPRVLLAGGLVEDEFPSPPPPLLRLRSNRAATVTEHIASQRYLFAKFLTQPRKRVLLFWPLLRERDEEFIPSQFFSDFGVDPYGKNLAELTANLKVDLRMPLDTLTHPYRSGAEAETLRNIAVGVLAYRWRAEASDTIFDSQVGSQSLKNRLRTAVGNFCFNAHSLTMLSKCPRRFFFEKVLNARKAPDEGMLRRMRLGSMVHALLAEFCRSWNWEHDPIIADEGNALELLRKQFDRFVGSCSEFERRMLQVEMFGGEDCGLFGYVGHCTAFLRFERKVRENENLRTIPVHVEKTFPSLEDDPEPSLVGTLVTPKRKLLVSGRIDRLDKNAGFYFIVDYKTGSDIPTIKAQLEGLELQIPLYVLVALQSGLTCGGGYFIQVRATEAKVNGYFIRESAKNAVPLPGRPKLLDDSLFDQNLPQLVAKIDEVVDHFENGHFIPTPDKKACQKCPFRSVTCRIFPTVSPEAED